MKIDAKVRFSTMYHSSVDGWILKKGIVIDIPVDLDYVDDYDDVIAAVEAEIFQKYRIVPSYEEDYTILNASEICEEISS